MDPAPVATLADEFLADLGEDDDLNEESGENEDESEALDKGKEKEGGEMELEKNLETDDVHKVAKLRSSARLRSIVQRIQKFADEGSSLGSVEGAGLEDHPEYELIVEATNITLELGDEMSIVHKFIRDHYAKRFPELESIVTNPVDYANAVKRIGNQTDITMVDLSDILPAAIIMIVSVTASTTEGTPLEEDQMGRVIEACDEMLALEQDRIRILGYVEGRMDIVAPNLSAVTGSSIAARLMGIAGGLTALSKLPANIVQLLGNKRKASTGLSAGGIHAGLINECDLVQTAPSSLQMKVRRLVATKCTLCARVDAFHEAAHGEVGQRFREEIQRKIEKWQDPPAPKAPKPLPAPDDQPRKKRGGKRARKQKEKFGVTELRKQANRMAFGVEAEETLGNTGRGLGLIGRGTGKVRLSAEQKGILGPRAKRPRIAGTASTVPGTATGLASSLAFTPVQGMELRVTQTQTQSSEKYFSSNSGFAKVSNNTKRE
jgi:U4/U6 small nuclear ribonucleoprotein PRP31